MTRPMRLVCPIFMSALMLLCGCSHNPTLRQALKSAGGNRAELEAVLEHYRTADPDHEKLAAAEFLISNMSSHYSYRSDKIPLETATPYRYWRYLSPDGSYGSMAELAFFNEDTARMDGKKPIGSTADAGILMRAFDSDWITNFETDEPDGNWIGVDMGEPSVVSYVRVVPRSDDNDIHPGETYEFRYMNPQGGWVSRDAVTATDNVLHYDSVPAGALMWVRDLTRGWDERVFLIDDDGNPEWW